VSQFTHNGFYWQCRLFRFPPDPIEVDHSMVGVLQYFAPIGIFPPRVHC
jgi:hypothetical protein